MRSVSPSLLSLTTTTTTATYATFAYISRKIVRVLRESTAATCALRRAISPSFHLNRERPRARASHVSTLLFLPFENETSARSLLLRAQSSPLLLFAARVYQITDIGSRQWPLHFTSSAARFSLASPTYCCLILLFNRTSQSVFWSGRERLAKRAGGREGGSKRASGRKEEKSDAGPANHRDLVSSPFIPGSSDHLGIVLFLVSDSHYFPCVVTPAPEA